MMKKLLNIFLLSVVVLLSGCEKDSNSEIIEKKDPSHTSLIYIVADNNLNSYPQGDIKEMIEGYKEVQHQENNTLLVYIDDYSAPRLLRIKNENGKVISKTIKEFPEQNSLDLDVMAQTINQSLNRFEADSYGLILWSHGDGWLPGTDQEKTINTRRFGEDSNDGQSHQSHYMDIMDLKNALSTTPGFEYIVFDACNMLGIEVAYELRGLTEYVIGSPVEVSAYGAPYQDMVPALFSQSDKAKNIAYAFYNRYAENYSYDDFDDTRSLFSKSSIANEENNNPNVYQYGVAIAAISCKNLDELAQATRTILKKYGKTNTSISTKELYNYDSNYYNFYYDLKGLVGHISNPESPAWKTWQSAFQKAVLLFLTTENTYSSFENNGFGGKLSMAKANGVSTFIPFNENFGEAYKWSHGSGKDGSVNSVYQYYRDYYSNLEWYRAAGWINLMK